MAAVVVGVVAASRTRLECGINHPRRTSHTHSRHRFFHHSPCAALVTLCLAPGWSASREGWHAMRLVHFPDQLTLTIPTRAIYIHIYIHIYNILSHIYIQCGRLTNLIWLNCLIRTHPSCEWEYGSVFYLSVPRGSSHGNYCFNCCGRHALVSYFYTTTIYIHILALHSYQNR